MGYILINMYIERNNYNIAFSHFIKTFLLSS